MAVTQQPTGNQRQPEWIEADHTGNFDFFNDFKSLDFKQVNIKYQNNKKVANPERFGGTGIDFSNCKYGLVTTENELVSVAQMEDFGHDGKSVKYTYRGSKGETIFKIFAREIGLNGRKVYRVVDADEQFIGELNLMLPRFYCVGNKCAGNFKIISKTGEHIIPFQVIESNFKASWCGSGSSFAVQRHQKEITHFKKQGDGGCTLSFSDFFFHNDGVSILFPKEKFNVKNNFLVVAAVQMTYETYFKHRMF